MTALRFQTGGRHQTSPASLRGPEKKKDNDCGCQSEDERKEDEEEEGEEEEEEEKTTNKLEIDFNVPFATTKS